MKGLLHVAVGEEEDPISRYIPPKGRPVPFVKTSKPILTVDIADNPAILHHTFSFNLSFALE